MLIRCKVVETRSIAPCWSPKQCASQLRTHRPGLVLVEGGRDLHLHGLVHLPKHHETPPKTDLQWLAHHQRREVQGLRCLELLVVGLLRQDALLAQADGDGVRPRTRSKQEWIHMGLKVKPSY